MLLGMRMSRVSGLRGGVEGNEGGGSWGAAGGRSCAGEEGAGGAEDWKLDELWLKWFEQEVRAEEELAVEDVWCDADDEANC
jgi:hypothetical protein